MTARSRRGFVSVRLVVNLALSMLMLGLCLWLIWPNAETMPTFKAALQRLTVAKFGPYVAGFYGLLLLVHWCRSWRWHYLLKPMGVELDATRLLAVSSVGFMAIMLLPARLGEFV